MPDIRPSLRARNDVAWEFEEANGFDQEMLDTYRLFTRLHLRLWPLAWSLAHAMLEDGRPLQRPFGLQHPELGMHPWDAYFFGDDLLVAPVVTEGARARIVPFPPGDWFDWWTGERIVGGVDLEVPAPLDTLPLFLRAGGIVPMLRPTIDTLAPVLEVGPGEPSQLRTIYDMLNRFSYLGDGACTSYTLGTQEQKVLRGAGRLLGCLGRHG